MNGQVSHDPREFVRGLQQILISDTKKVGFLFGAGTSCAAKKGVDASKVPAVREMTQSIIDSISEPKYKNALQCIKQEFEYKNIGFNIEYILSSITQKEEVVAKECLCGLNEIELHELREIIEKEIIKLVSVHKNREVFINNAVHADFAQWILQASRKHPIEIFTTNYDYLFELGLEFHNVPYFDGFVGSFEPFFHALALEDMNFLPEHTKLWKLHGSLGWQFNNDRERKIIRKQPDDSKIMIYPSLLKYDNSKKQPYVSFMDRLSKFVKQDDSILFISGYSFSDQHINDVIVNALKSTSTSHVIGFYFDELLEDSDVVTLAKRQSKLSIYSKEYAVIGGRYGQWRLKNVPNNDDSIMIGLYFDEDAALPNDDKGMEYDTWNGQGKFLLQDFTKFVEFLSFLDCENYKGACGASI